jgi:hypothetical protein
MTKKAIIFFLLLCVCGLTHAADVEFPLVQSLAYFPYHNQPTLAKNDFRVFLDMNYSNVYMYDSSRITINDMETWTNTLGLGYGLTDRITLELYYRAGVAYGGVLDKFIMDFHKFFGMSESGRKDYPTDMMNYRYKDYFAYDNGEAIQAPLILGALGRIYTNNNGNLHINGRLAVGLPLSSKPGFSSNRPFLTGGIMLLYKTKRLSIHFSNHISFFKTPKWMAAEDMRNSIFHGILLKTTPFKAYNLENNAKQIYLGFKFLKYFEFSLVEEFPPMDTTPDVNFNLRINIKM